MPPTYTDPKVGESTLRARLTELLTGASSGALLHAGQAASRHDNRPDPEATTAHRISTARMASRIGAGNAVGVGLAREIADGIRQLLKGKPVFGPEGFSREDLRANWQGATGSLTEAERAAVSALRFGIDPERELP